MRILVQRATAIALLLPIMAAAASSARSEYASVLKAKPDPVRGEQLFGHCMSRLELPGKRGIGSGEFVAEGSRIYAAKCQSCHGEQAEGNNERGVPRLAGQHYSYLVRQMFDAVDGRRPTLPKLHSQRIEPLDYEQVRAVSDFLARVGW